MVIYYQDSLFSPRPYRVADRGDFSLTLTPEALSTWQKKVYNFQQQVRGASVSQTSLFSDMNFSPLDPFKLPIYPEDFYRLDQASSDACIYFVCDLDAYLILYIGETNNLQKRWQGLHDCKKYLQQYRSVSRSTIGFSFYWQAPMPKRSRQRLEKSLILHWRSPFNKENWQYWHTPFIC
ncbi:MAG: GIY-YIG nuclease family protein [Pseudanabaenaceae cyanobacterium SKYGB_i_bin29]|nr:GIY-YIG nuclease family protein [Pseudanabaenaceae cyanobacterium SKYG29]MDW8421416.1 GIY-YIG nuclease family protein [Pseudanabaenaceae cyanobacterium SKYGB_i_bin29]